ncbi:MAG: hypothetical protein KBT03_12460 [Bacteroidales bacterium]|nr:hypothetical protein [Candidatus Scybalousia scybalohippi]
MNKFKQLLLVLLLCAVNVVFAQAPQMFTYQAVVRNASGQLIGNQIVGVKISILQGSVTGLPVYEETHLSTTNTNGLLTISVGNGNVQTGTFSSINWGSGLYFIKSEIDPAGGNNYTLISTTQMMSVPYALHANTADQLTTPFTESQILSISNDTIYLTGGSFVKLPSGFSGDYNDLTNTPTIPTVPTNVSSFTNDAGYITNAEVPTNVSQLTNDAGYLTSFTESQILSISNDTIYLTGGSFVKLPSGFSGDYNDLTNKPTIPTVPTNVSEFINDAGYITTADVPTNVSQLTNDAGYLTSFTESQILSISNDTIYLTGGSFVKLPSGFSGDYNDLTNTPTIPIVPTNVSAFTNDAGYITGADIPVGFSGDYNDLTNKPTIPTVPTNVSEFTNDAGYITSYTETQNLADVVASGNSAGNAQIKDVNDPTDPKDAVNLQYLTAIISQLQHQVDSLSNVTTGIGEAMCGELEIIDGALPGIFSISATKTVEFSRGNLQYTTTGTHTVSGGGTEPGTWRFAEHQYDVIGEENSEISSTYTGWIDLFGWGTSGWNSGAVAYQPYSTSTNNNDYNVGGTTVNSLTGSCSKADWGVYNAISNGGNQPGMWRTLTSEELQYIFTTRSQANRFIKASIAGKKGIIIFPDNYTQPSYLPPLVSVNMSEASFSDNSYNLTQWAKMEILGCVFLPITGARTGNVMGSETNGYYQTSTMADDIRKWHICFGSSSVNPGTHSDGRRSGQGVRLVKEVN